MSSSATPGPPARHLHAGSALHGRTGDSGRPFRAWVGLVRPVEGPNRAKHSRPPADTLDALPAPSPPLVLPPDLSGTSAAVSESRATSLQTAPGLRLCGAPASRRQTPGPVRVHRGGGRGLLVSKSISHALSGHMAGADALTSQGPFPQGAPTCTVRASRRARR